jgi:hypothetical protein
MMKHRSSCGQVSAIVILAALIVAGCANRPPAPVLALPALPGPPPIQLGDHDIGTIAVVPPPSTFPWLAVGEFYPLGSRRILPRHGYHPPDIVETPRMWYPAIGECTSPNGEWTLFHEARPAGADVEHIIFVQRRGEEKRRPIFLTRQILEVLWSPDSSRIAITVLTGLNRSVVSVMRMEEPREPIPVVVDEALRSYMTEVQIGAPRFLMALRWAKVGELVLRARGQEPLEPFTIFGYEVAVDTDHVRDPSAVRFLRGFTKPPDSVAVPSK